MEPRLSRYRPPRPRSQGGSPFGAGLFLGKPIGVTAKHNFDARHLVDAIAAWSFGKGLGFYLQADYVHHFRGLMKVERESIRRLRGGRGAMAFYGTDAFGLRFPAGLAYTFRPVPIEVFVELGLNFFIAPSTSAGLTVGSGARYFF